MNQRVVVGPTFDRSTAPTGDEVAHDGDGNEYIPTNSQSCSQLDDALGIRARFAPNVVGQLEKRQKADLDDVRSFRQAVARRLALSLSTVVVVVTVVLLVGTLFDVTAPGPRSIAAQYLQAWRHFQGAVSPEVALTVNTTSLALVASINVAFAAMTRREDRRDNALNSAWRRAQTWIALLAGSAPQVLSIMQFNGIGDGPSAAGDGPRADYGTAAAAIFVGVCAGFLAVTLVEYGTTADLARNFVDAENRRKATAAWVSEIERRGVPVHFPATSGLRLRRLPKVRRIQVIAVLFTLLPLAYTFFAVEVLAWSYGRGFLIPGSGSDVRLALAILGYSAAVTYVIGFFMWQRWSTTKTKSLRLRLTVWPICFRSLYLVVVVLLSVLLGMKSPQDWRGGVLTAVVTAGPIVVLPFAAWIVFWLRRRTALNRVNGRNSQQNWRGRLVEWCADRVVWLAAPIWQNVTKSLELSIGATPTRASPRTILSSRRMLIGPSSG